jgi:anti-sigma regulatory factor (Ser/Thr protein kinase)
VKMFPLGVGFFIAKCVVDTIAHNSHEDT